MTPRGESEKPGADEVGGRPKLALGITTPVLTMLPGAHARWEEHGTIEDVAAIARTADRLGYHHLTCSEHIVIPTEVATVRGSRYWDPLATFGYLAALTTEIRFATNVVVLGYHHPLEIAKRYGTLDQVAQGRVILGLGVGSLRPEFELLGVPFDDRGSRGRRCSGCAPVIAVGGGARVLGALLPLRRRGDGPVRPPAERSAVDRGPDGALVAARRCPG